MSAGPAAAEGPAQGGPGASGRPGGPSRAASALARSRRSIGVARWSLRRRLGYAFAIAGALLVAGCVLGAVALNGMISAVNVQVNRLDPALRHTDGLLASLLDQETGVRGYLLTGQRSFLQPYQLGVRQAASDEAKLHAVIDVDPALRRDLLATERRADAWRTAYAAPAIAAAGDRHQPSPALEATGKRDFDAFRTDLGALYRQIAAERHAALARLDSATSWVLIVAITGAVALIGVAAAAWFGLTSWVIRPLADLGDEAQAVALGEIGHELSVAGPREIMELAADVDAMRRQLLHNVDDLSQKAGELQRSNRELEQFAYVASHDLQEPLRKVASFCQMLESRYAAQLDDRARQYIYYAVDGAKRMQLLINELLMFSRVGQHGMVRADVDLNECAAQAVDALDAPIADTDAEVIIDELPAVSGDQALLTQLFQNLIANSIKFRRVDEHPVVRLTAAPDGDCWQFACQDNGIGIAPAHADRVFAIFQRLHPREAYPGTGIGLAMCRKIVDFHGGQIWVDTTDPGAEGTTIRWTLPAGERRPAAAS